MIKIQRLKKSYKLFLGKNDFYGKAKEICFLNYFYVKCYCLKIGDFGDE